MSIRSNEMEINRAEVDSCVCNMVEGECTVSRNNKVSRNMTVASETTVTSEIKTPGGRVEV